VLVQKVSRRVAVGVTVVAISSLAASAARFVRKAVGKVVRGARPARPDALVVGPGEWQMGESGTRPADDVHMQIKGYASATSVNLGESIDFHVTTSPVDDFTVAVYRCGHNAGAGGLRMVTSPTLRGTVQPPPDIDNVTGMISCAWSPAWTLGVPTDWSSGYYIAVFTTSNGYRSYTPFVVRDDARRADLCVVIPFSTYQAYNQWPRDGRTGKSLYYGYGEAPASGASAPNVYDARALQVCFDRPYDNHGMPNLADLDQTFIQWAEERGYDMVYVGTADLHDGRVDPSAYAGMVFCGHDEYWSREMRDRVASAVDEGTSMAFLTANNVYWHIRLSARPGQPESRMMTCYKTTPDPDAPAGEATGQWRESPPNPNDSEQRLIGILYNGIVGEPTPLIVQNSDHWFWQGTGLRDGDRIERIVAGEADGYLDHLKAPAAVEHTLLSASPYQRKIPDGPDPTQNTSIYTNAAGAIVFGAGSLYWPYGLGKRGYADERVKRATANVLDRIVARRPSVKS
jgi:hypothetical protein